MDDSSLRELADALSQVLRPHLERSEALRRTVALIGKWLIEEANQVGPVGPTTAKPPQSDEPDLRPVSSSPASTPRSDEPDMRVAVATVVASPSESPPLPMESALVALRLGDAVAHVPLSGTSEELGRARQSAIEPKAFLTRQPGNVPARGETDLALVERRCRLKAASCRLFVKKRAAEANTDAEYSARHEMNQMIAQAKAMPNCFLWVFWRERTQPDDGTLATIAETYDAHADAVALARRINESDLGQPADVAEALQLLAEANSALRGAMAGTWLTDDDRDQDEVHAWLRGETASQRVFLDRHMTADDPAEPVEATGLRARVKQVSKRLDDRVGRAKGIKSAISQIKYHAGQIVKNGSDGSLAHWTKISDAVARLESMGIATSDRRVSEAVGAEAVEWFPDEAMTLRGLPDVISRARALAGGLNSDPDVEEDAIARDWSKSVLEVRELLRGTRAVVIGGERNGEAVGRLIDAFQLKDAEWVALNEHGSSSPMRAPIFRSDTGVILVIIKLTGHLHADEARDFANAAGKPCIFLSGGYNPERVARAVLDQASARLRRG